MPATDSSDFDFNDLILDYASAVGLLTIYWAALENSLIAVIECLLEVDQLTAQCVAMTSDKAAGRANLIKRLVLRPNLAPSEEWANCMAGFCDQIANHMGEERNRFIHDDWYPKETQIVRTNRSLKIGKPQARKPKTLLAHPDKPIDTVEIYALTDRVVYTMMHMTVLSAKWTMWRRTGQPQGIPEQSILLSKGILPNPPQPEV